MKQNLPSIQEILVKFVAKVDIFIHHKGQFLSPNSRLAECYQIMNMPKVEKSNNCV